DVLEAGGPVGGDEGGSGQRQQRLGKGDCGGRWGDGSCGWRLARAISEETAIDAEPNTQTDCERRDDQDGGNEDAEGSEQLEKDGEQRDAEHGLRQPGRGP